MKKVLLFTFLFIGLLGTDVISQSIDCISESGSPATTLPAPGDIIIDNTGSGDEGDYTSVALGTTSTMFFNFTVGTNGSYNFAVSSSTGGASGISYAIFDLAGGCPGSIAELGTVTAGGGPSTELNCLESGTEYMLVIATEDTEEGMIEFNVTMSMAAPTNDLCSSAIAATDGMLVDNTCDLDGIIWYSYTYSGAGDLEDLNIGLTGGTLGSPFIYDVFAVACSGTTLFSGESPSELIECLQPGDVILFGVGNDMPDYGNFTINLTEADNSVVNEICDDATLISEVGNSNGVLECLELEVLNNNTDACADPEATGGACGIDPPTAGEASSGDPGVWYTFTTGTDIEEFEFVGAGNFEVFTGACGALTSLGCAGPFVNTTAGTQYWVLVSGGPVTVQSLPTTAPTNDLCPGTGVAIGVGTTNGDNRCATMDALVTCESDHVVYYEYTVGATNEDLTITLTADAGGAYPMGAGSVSVWEDCVGTDTDVAVWDEVNGDGISCTLGMPVDLTCVPAGTTIVIAVGSSTTNAGAFELDITAATSTSIPANDDCGNAVTLTNGTVIAGDNSCSSLVGGEVLGSCSTGDENGSVWYTYTATSDLQNVTFTLTPGGVTGQYVAAYDGCTGAELALAGNPSCDVTEIMIECVKNGDVIAIQVASDLSTAGAFTIVANETASVAGDSCEDPIFDVSSHILECGETMMFDADPNACPDPDQATCTSTTDPGVWYYFEVDPDIPEILITGASFELFSQPTMNPAFDCTALTSLGCASPMLIPDPALGYLILVTGTTGSVTITPSPNPVSVNEDCATPTMANAGTTPGNNVCASAGAACGGSNDGHVVYFSYMTGALPEDITIDLNASGMAPAMTDGSIIVTEDCSGANTNVVIWDQVNMTGEACDGLNENVELSCVPANTTIIIAIGSDDQGDSGAGPAEVGNFDLVITTADPTPANDECTASTNIPSSGVALTMESNACATYDIDVGSCGGEPGQGESSVWYDYVLSNDVQDITITVSGGDITSPVLAVYQDCVGTLYDVGSEDCAGSEVIIDCPAQGTLFIHVSSESLDEGTFDITVTEGGPVVAHDVCTDPMPTVLVDCIPLDITISNLNACPEGGPLGVAAPCDFDMNPTVWVEVEIPADGVGFDFTNFGPNTSITLYDNACPPTMFDPAGCMNADTEILGLAPGIYLIGVSSPTANEGDQTFSVTVIVPPDNDLCADAELLNLGVPLTGETTVCATVDITNTCNPAATSQVWYTYTVPAGGHNELTVDVTNFSGVTDDINVFGLDCGSNAFLNQADGSMADYCGGEGTELLTFTCLEEGDVISIAVGSDPTNEGTFDITLNDETDNPDYDATCLANDYCADLVEDIGVIDTDNPAGETCLPGCNTLACPDDEINTICGGNVTNAVFYQFTTDADPLLNDGVTDVFLQISLQNSCLTMPVIAVFEGTCGAYTSYAPIGCFVGGNTTGPVNVFNAILPNTTYTIVIGSNDLEEGCDGFDVCVEISTGCANDECEDAVDLDATGGMAMSQNTGCTEDATLYDCGGDEVTSAWYSFTMPTGTSTMNISITPAPASGYSINVIEACGDAATVDDGSFCGSAGDEQIFCLAEETTYWIQVSTLVGEELMFDITLTGDPPTVMGDLCSDPIPMPALECEWDNFCFETTDACPENFTLPGGCAIDVDPTVWGSLVLPATAYGIEFRNFDDPGSYLTVMADDLCEAMPTASLPDCVSGTANTIVPVTGGSTVNIAMSNPLKDNFCFEFRILVAPIGDDPNGLTTTTDDDFVIIGAGAGGANGTTCCATGVNSMPPDQGFDAPCAATNGEHVVWYVFTTLDADQGYEITVSFGSGLGGFQVHEGAFDGDILGSDCTASEDVSISNCFDEGTEIWVKIGSPLDGCGGFTINIVPITCATADECPDAEVITTEPAGACAVGQDTYEGCIFPACPDGAACATDPDLPTVWIQVDPIADGSEDPLGFTTIIEADGFDLTWELYSGTDCTDMVLTGQQNGAMGITTCGQEGEPFTVPVNYVGGVPNSLWIAVTATSEVEDPSFTITYYSLEGCISCIEDSPTACNAAEWTANGLEGDQTFCPGEEVEICFMLNYNTTATGDDWLHAMFPSFGPGWDVINSDFTNITGANAWEWFDEDDSSCPPTLNTFGAELPNWCTFVNSAGFLELCNTQCSDCPCSGPMVDGDALPGGWFSTTPACGNDGSCPFGNFGIQSGQDVDINACFTLMVKTFESMDECLEDPDLRIYIQTASDGIVGCWDDQNPCVLDPSQQSPMYTIDCDIPPAVLAENTEWCNKYDDGPILILTNEFGDLTNMDVVACDNPNVTGENLTITSYPGYAEITDVLCNETSVPQVVMYKAISIDPAFMCPGVMDTFEVTVYPDLVVEFDPPYTVCYDGQGDSTIELEPNVQGGFGSGYTYVWDDDNSSITSSIVVPESLPAEPGVYEYCVVVTDALGCVGSSCTEITVLPPLDYCLGGDTELCKDGIDPVLNEEFKVVTSSVKDLANTTPIASFDWCSEPPGLEWMPFSNIGELVIDEANSAPGTYMITMKLEDVNGCEFVTEPWEFTISEPPTADLEITNCDQSGTEVCFTGIPAQVTAMQICDADGNPLSGANTIFDAGCFTFTDLGDYSLKVINTVVCPDFENCDCIGIIDFSLDPPLTPVITVPPVCLGGDAIGTVTNPTDFNDITWLDTNTSSTSGYTIIGLTQDSIVFIEYTDVNGCTSFGQVEFTVLANPEVEITGASSLCPGSTTDYAVNILNEDPDVNYNYNWSPNGQMTSSITETVNGDIIFCVTVTTDEGCEGSDCIDVTVESEITLEPFTANICETDEITIGIDGSIYTVTSWDDSGSSTTDSITVSGTAAMSPLTFEVEFEDVVNNCNGSGMFTIIIDPLPQASVTDTVTICNNSLFGSILDLTGEQGSSGPGVWSDVNFITGLPFDPTNVDFDGIAAQDVIFAYTTNIAGDSPCPEASDTLVVKVENCECDEVIVGSLADVCAGEADEIFIGGIGIGTTTNNADADWAFVGNSSNMTIQGDTIILYDENTAEGTYTIEYMLTDIDPSCAGLAGNSGTISFMVWEQPILEILQDTTVCNADVGQGEICLDFNNFVLTTNGTVNWTSDPAFDTAGGDFSDLSNVCFDFVGSPANTTYSFTADVAGNGECEGVTQTIDVTTLDCDCGNPNTNGFPLLCNSGGCFNINDPAIIGSADDGFWALIPGGTGDDSTISFLLGTGEVCADENTVAGTYIFQYTLNPPFGGSCIDISTQTLTVLQAPTASFLPTDTTACNIVPVQGGGNILDIASLLTSSDNGAGDWTSNPVGLDLSDPSAVDFASLNGNVGDVFTITYTTSSATDPCEDVSTSITITLIDCDCLPIAVSDPADVCAVDGTTVDLCALVGASDPGDWSIGTASNGGDAATISLAGCEVTVSATTAPGTYEFEYTLNPPPADGCTLSDIATLVVLGPVDAGVPNETPLFCEYETGTVTLADLLDDEDTGGIWSESSIIPSTGSAFDDVNGTFTIDGQVPGSYTFVYSFDANGPCPGDMETVEVIIEAEPMADAGADGFTDCTNLTATIGNPAGSSSGPEFTYSWVDANGTEVSTDIPFETGIPGVYTLIVTNTTTGCFAEDVTEIVADPDVPGFEATAEDSDCFGDNSGSINITGASGGTGTYTVIVTGDLDTTFIYTDPSNLDGLPPGSYSIMLEDSNGCQSGTLPLAIAENEEFVIIDNPDVDSLSFGTEYSLTISEWIDQSLIEQVIWTVDGDIVCAAPPSSIEECNEILVLVERAREVCITLIDSTGCEDTDCLWLRIQLENDVYPPNVFDPKLGDDNGWLFPQTSANGEEVIYFRVFDRWGELIFENSNFPPNVPSEGWDGTYNGREANQGVYVYQYEVRFENGELRQVATDATLIR